MGRGCVWSATSKASTGRGIVGRDTGESYDEFLTKLAKASGIGTPTRADLARPDRPRKKKGSNDDWTHPHHPDAKITARERARASARHASALNLGLWMRMLSASVRHAPCRAV